MVNGAAGSIGVRLPVTGARGWIVRVQPAAGTLHHMLEHAGWRVGPGDSPTSRDRPRGRRDERDASGRCRRGPPPACGRHRPGRVVAPALGHPEPEDPACLSACPRGDRLAPSLGDATVTSTWWGLRPLSPDERPLVGTVREGLVVATGHGSEGVILGAGTATLDHVARGGRHGADRPAAFMWPAPHHEAVMVERRAGPHDP